VLAARNRHLAMRRSRIRPAALLLFLFIASREILAQNAFKGTYEPMSHMGPVVLTNGWPPGAPGGAAHENVM
jgi:hypothetical protein